MNDYGNDMKDNKQETETQEQERVNNLKEKIEIRRKQQVNFIITQTNYDENEACEKLKLYNNDVMKVISEYLGITPKEDINIKKTKNQKIYTVIREIMDKGSRNFQIQQERQERIKKIEEFKKTIESKNEDKGEKNEIGYIKKNKEKID